MTEKGKLEGRDKDDTVLSLAIAYRCVDDGGSQASFNIIGQDDDPVNNNHKYEKSSESGVRNNSSPDVNIGIV